MAFESDDEKLLLVMGWLMMKCPEFTASQNAFDFALFAADIYRKLMLLSWEKSYEEDTLHMLRFYSHTCNELGRGAGEIKGQGTMK